MFQVVDMILPQSSRTQDLQVVRDNQATGTTTFITNASVVSNIITYPQLEPGMYQVITPIGMDGTLTGVSVVNQ